MLAPALLAFLPFLISPAEARGRQGVDRVVPVGQEAPKQPEAFRVRIANTLFGAVEVSADSGATWTLIGRVQKAALSPADGGTSVTPAVERASKDGIAFAIGGRRLLRILPDLPANYKNGSAMVVSLPPLTGLFRELLPTAGSGVQQIINKRDAALPTDYVPRDGDQFLITVPRGTQTPDQLSDLVKRLGDRYREGIDSRMRALGRKPTNGTLTVTVNLSAGERLSALTYFLDGEVLAIQNQAPFSLKIDTRRWPNGEHILEARAVDMNGSILTQKKTLLFVDNTPAPTAP